MDDFSINNLLSYNTIGDVLSKKEKTGANSQTDDFSSLMMLMMNSMGQTGESGDSMSASAMMMPLMVQLLEKMQSSTASISPPAGDPVNGVITQEFGSAHRGIDYGIDEGTAIKSTMNGKVVFAGWNDEGYGNLVIVENGPFKTYYGHLSEIPVSVGEEISKGSIVGFSGNTGNSTGPHLHYEIRINGKTMNPKNAIFTGDTNFQV